MVTGPKLSAHPGNVLWLRACVGIGADGAETWKTDNGEHEPFVLTIINERDVADKSRVI